MPSSQITLGVVGSGGDGVITVGEMIAQAAASEGLDVIKTEAYGPQIRGGESSCTVRISQTPIEAQADVVDVMVIFNWPDYNRFKGEMVPAQDAVILYEASDPTPVPEGISPKGLKVAVPFVELATKFAGTMDNPNRTRSRRVPGRRVDPAADRGHCTVRRDGSGAGDSHHRAHPRRRGHRHATRPAA